MQSRVPLPTDNIYKFYAFFGLLLLISSSYLFISSYESYRTTQNIHIVELLKLEAIDELNKEQKSYKSLLEVQMKTEKSNKYFYNFWIGIFFGLAIVFIIIGFGAWQFTIQPKQDRLIQLTTEKLELELLILKKINK